MDKAIKTTKRHPAKFNHKNAITSKYQNAITMASVIKAEIKTEFPLRCFTKIAEMKIPNIVP